MKILQSAVSYTLGLAYMVQSSTRVQILGLDPTHGPSTMDEKSQSFKFVTSNYKYAVIYW